jgi:hypothetical protein
MLIDFDRLHKIKKQSPKPGDIFAIELSIRAVHPYKSDKINFTNPKNNFAFGRIINIDHVKDVIIEIFNYFGEFLFDVEKIISSGRMFDPINVTGLCFSEGRWKIISSTPSFDKNLVGFKEIKLVMGIPPNIKLWKGGQIFTISESDSKGIERYVSYFPIDIETRINQLKQK